MAMPRDNTTRILILMALSLISGLVVNKTKYVWIQDDEIRTNKKELLRSCFDLERHGSMNDVLAKYERVVIVAPPKAAGTSLSRFAGECAGGLLGENSFDRNILNTPKKREYVLSQDADVLPSVIASHISNDVALVDLLKYIPQKSLIIYVHRQETDRFASAIRHVVDKRICRMGDTVPAGIDKGPNFYLDRNRCIIDEATLFRHVQNKIYEMKSGSSQIWSCGLYQYLDENGSPDLVIMNYKQANNLQRVVAKRYCPNQAPIRHPSGTPGRTNYVRLSSDALNNTSNRNQDDDDMSGIVKLNDWLQRKKTLLDYYSRMEDVPSSPSSYCQAKTKHMENLLLQCKDQTMEVAFLGIEEW